MKIPLRNKFVTDKCCFFAKSCSDLNLYVAEHVKLIFVEEYLMADA